MLIAETAVPSPPAISPIETHAAVFLSYAREDCTAARRVAEALRAAAITVWFDEKELRGGDAWDAKIRQQIGQCTLFLPLVSRTTQERAKGYFRLEWRLAVEQSQLLARGVPFLLPVAIDGTSESAAIVPPEFLQVQWIRLRDALPTAEFVTQVAALLAAPSRPTPALASPAVRESGERSIAVLPFANMSAEPDNEYFSDGITEEIINALAQVPGLRVASRTSSFAFKQKLEDLRVIAARLGVRTILEGSVRKAGNRIRITAQLINAADGYHLWSEKFDRSLDDIFAVQDEIAATITEKLRGRLDGARDRRTGRTADVEAYQLYLQGRHFWSQRGTGLARALQCFEGALARDPDYARAHAGAADCYSLLGFYGYAPPNVVLRKARAAAERALDLDPDLAEAHTALGFILISLDRDFRAAEQRLRQAVELDPQYMPARYWLASAVGGRRGYAEAVAVDEEAVQLEPYSLFASVHLAWMLLSDEKPREAIQRLRYVLELEPRLSVARWLLGQCLLSVGQQDDGIGQLRKAVELSGDLAWWKSTLGCGLAYIGHTAEAREVLDELVLRSKTEYVRSAAVAMLLGSLGDRDGAIRWLERARDENDAVLPYMARDVDNPEIFAATMVSRRMLGPERHAQFVATLNIKV